MKIKNTLLFFCVVFLPALVHAQTTDSDQPTVKVTKIQGIYSKGKWFGIGRSSMEENMLQPYGEQRMGHEWREGISPSRSHSSGRDSLPSSGSYRPERSKTFSPMCKQPWLLTSYSPQQCVACLW
jgi:hypothetical protein